ncbi:MAG: Conserved virulence factor B [SAR116 cluster bacterium]|jgi:predicted RNA-binding protein (virulence factor B family)|nr:MAG: Conserved virulence factor B [SAR116 cluster bacterium]
MIVLGKFNTLEILRDTSVGLFLGDGDGTDILLPNKYVPEQWEIGDKLSVFCYLDHEERPVATNIEPYVQRDCFALLRVVEVNAIGAFLDWGLEKHLLVPFKEQRSKMQEGQSYVVYCYLDELTFRLVGSNKLDKFLDNSNAAFETGDRVEALVTRKSDLGWDVIVNNQFKGMVYENEVFKQIAVGDRMTAYVKQQREDHKLDISLQALGVAVLEPSAKQILTLLEAHKGFLPLHDKSDPQEIKAYLEMSKKVFKKAIGTLYKNREIRISTDGIYLNQK